jgi:anti-sigma B factor antagonist
MDVPEHQQVQVQIETSPDGGRVSATVTGEIDAATAEAFEQELRPALAGASTVVLDLSGVSFMDSSGLRSLMVLHADVASRGVRIELSDTSSAVERLLTVTGLDQQFTRPS